MSSEYADAVLRDAAGPVVSLSTASVGPVTVDFSTTDGTAIHGIDYASTKRADHIRARRDEKADSGLRRQRRGE